MNNMIQRGFEHSFATSLAMVSETFFKLWRMNSNTPPEIPKQKFTEEFQIKFWNFLKDISNDLLFEQKMYNLILIDSCNKYLIPKPPKIIPITKKIGTVSKNETIQADHKENKVNINSRTNLSLTSLTTSYMRNKLNLEINKYLKVENNLKIDLNF